MTKGSESDDDAGIDELNLAGTWRGLNAEQLLSNADQSASHDDQLSADDDQTSSAVDQRSADQDQRASDRDQAIADSKLAAQSNPSADDMAAHETSRLEREGRPPSATKAGPAARPLPSGVMRRARNGIEWQRHATRPVTLAIVKPATWPTDPTRSVQKAPEGSGEPARIRTENLVIKSHLLCR